MREGEEKGNKGQNSMNDADKINITDNIIIYYSYI